MVGNHWKFIQPVSTRKCVTEIFSSGTDTGLYTGSFGQSIILSSVLQIGIAIFAIWISFYVGNIAKIKLRNESKNLLSNAFFSSAAAVIIFIIIYFFLPFPLIDNRTADGYPAFIDIESIGYSLHGALHIVFIAIASLFL